MFDLIKIISILVYPLGQVMFLGLLAACLLLRRQLAGQATVLLTIGWLWMWSTPLFSDWLAGSLENGYPHLAAQETAHAGAIVVLGGGMDHPAMSWPYPRLDSGGDRYWHAARLYHAGRGDRIIISGGRAPSRPPGMSEAESAAIFIQDLGVPASAILLEDRALTTRENALNVRKLLREHGIGSFLLVTSALHMRRSEAVFRGAGLDPVPVATDFMVPDEPVSSLSRFLPSAYALEQSTRALHEYLGFWFYRLRGWI